MSIEGRISVDCLFHDKDGTASLKVISLLDSVAVSSGKVAVVSGTCGTAGVTIAMQPTTYRDSSGSLVSLSSVERTCIKAGPSPLLVSNPTIQVAANSVAIVPLEIADFDDPAQLPSVASASGTSSYTIVFLGS